MANARLSHTALLLRYPAPGLFPASAHHCCFGHHRFLRFQCDGEGKDKEGRCDGIKGIDFPQSRRHGAALAGAVGRQEVEEAAQLDWPPDQTSSEIGLIR